MTSRQRFQTCGKVPAELLKTASVLLVALGLGFGFWSATAAPPSGKCIVCHNSHNFHEISIPCDQVDKYLQDHPGDFAGPCNVTPVTNP
jgi:hypothetical protein